MKLPSLTLIVSGLFLAYMGNALWTIYDLFYPKQCPLNGDCISSFLKDNPSLQLSVYTASKERVRSESDLNLVWKWEEFDKNAEIDNVFNVTIPRKTRQNGTLYVHVFLNAKGDQLFARTTSYSNNLLTTYTLPQSSTFNLLGDTENTTEPELDKRIPISHWRTRLTISVMNEDVSFFRTVAPYDLSRLMRINDKRQYLPIVYIDQLSNRVRDLWPLNKTCKEMPLTIEYKPISVGKLRLWVNMQESIKMLQGLGFTEKDTDEVKGIFADTNFTFLMLTFAVAAFHMLFDFLAFKNDITYWKNRKTMVGLSTRVVIWRCVSTIIIFLYLMDEETSLLVLIPAGISCLIEIWKVKKALKVGIAWSGFKPSLTFGETSAQEKETADFDTQAMKYLSYLLWPLCIAGAIYSLLYTPHKSWYSWCINSLVNGIYAFGFLFMLPQLFLNYKLKSVAHLPWRAFMYKAFNTFIDDIFAFIITMPTAHRLACFRDDVIFIIYLYQRWLYPVDKKRVNEFGQSFEDEKGDKEKKQQ